MNIVDLVEGPKTGCQAVQTFNTPEALIEYTKLSGKDIQGGKGFAGGLLQHLLRQRAAEGKQPQPSKGGKGRNEVKTPRPSESKARSVVTAKVATKIRKE